MLILKNSEVRGRGSNIWVPKGWRLGSLSLGFEILLQWLSLIDHLLCLLLLIPFKHAALEVSPWVSRAHLIFELVLEEVFVDRKIRDAHLLILLFILIIFLVFNLIDSSFAIVTHHVLLLYSDLRSRNNIFNRDLLLLLL